ncbi:hypothetical protein [Acidianus ambivalens]|uniref:Uncharacterized protein n=1 Tax=Acidianus ambivalens TaxID=2283 RepID=A0A6G1T6P3_ACIAM|nr:hypothetical protein [Acidianus ambivalens]MQL56612.1 hypothetical protein [Acidianus ambivalens]
MIEGTIQHMGCPCIANFSRNTIVFCRYSQCVTLHDGNELNGIPDRCMRCINENYCSNLDNGFPDCEFKNIPIEFIDMTTENREALERHLARPNAILVIGNLTNIMIIEMLRRRFNVIERDIGNLMESIIHEELNIPTIILVTINDSGPCIII